MPVVICRHTASGTEPPGWQRYSLRTVPKKKAKVQKESSWMGLLIILYRGINRAHTACQNAFGCLTHTHTHTHNASHPASKHTLHTNAVLILSSSVPQAIPCWYISCCQDVVNFLSADVVLPYWDFFRFIPFVIVISSTKITIHCKNKYIFNIF